mmetsp:Transcript_26355/g.56025  ORF Transcript_26355/g.56025 Transcript_26355/m.56025 type:complete len:299 (-) Transcript_26355:73-969(-)
MNNNKLCPTIRLEHAFNTPSKSTSLRKKVVPSMASIPQLLLHERVLPPMNTNIPTITTQNDQDIVNTRILKIFIVILRQRHLTGSSKFCLILLFGRLIKLKFRRLKGRRLHKVKLVVPRQLPRKPEERLFKVVVRFGRNVIVLQILLSVECNLLRLYLTILDFYLVPREDDRDVFADACEIAVPVGNIFVGDAGSDIEHDDGALALDVVPVAQSSEFLLTCSVPDVEFDGTSVGVEHEGVDLDSEGGDVFFLKLACQMPLHESSLAYSTVTDEDEFKFWHILLSRHFGLFAAVVDDVR